ncbi:MAG: hypothetical protein ACK55H_00010 [Cyanobacteriota bacterium]
MADQPWIDQAIQHLHKANPGMQGQVLQQQAALALLQARREGAGGVQLEQALQACALEELRQALQQLQG